MIQIKNAKELDGMRKANALSAAALKYGGEHIEAGMTTWELDKLIYDFIVKHDATPLYLDQEHVISVWLSGHGLHQPERYRYPRYPFA